MAVAAQPRVRGALAGERWVAWPWIVLCALATLACENGASLAGSATSPTAKDDAAVADSPTAETASDGAVAEAEAHPGAADQRSEDTVDVAGSVDSDSGGATDGGAAGADADALGDALEVAGTSDGLQLDSDGGDAMPTFDAVADGVVGAVGDIGPEVDSAVTGDGPASADADSAAPTGDISEGDGGTASAEGPDASAGPPSNSVAIPVEVTTLASAAFVNVTSEYGIDPEVKHEFCVATGDFNSDGVEDFAVIEAKTQVPVIHVVLVQPPTVKHVYSTFDSTANNAKHGCSAADLDGDGKLDLLIGGQSGVSLYRGDGNGGLDDASDSWLPAIADYAAHSVAAADLDGDGDLDLYVGAGMIPPPCSGLECQFTATDLLCAFNPPPPSPAHLDDRVLLRQGGPPLVDVSAAWGAAKGGSHSIVQPLDINGDLKVDMLVGDEAAMPRLLINTGTSFQAYGKEIGLHPFVAAMGWAVGDFNGDGLPDIALADAGPTPVFSASSASPGKPPTLTDIGGSLGVWGPSYAASAWSPQVADFDHDGRDDLALMVAVNMSALELMGFISGCTIGFGTMTNPFLGKPSTDILYLQQPNGPMQALAMPPWPFAHGMIADQRAIDIDGDGDLDLVQTRPGPSLSPVARVRVLRNDLPKKGDSLRVTLVGKGGNTAALGSRVTAMVGGQLQTRWASGSGGFGGAAGRFLHFGLGGAKAAQAVTVHWPDGSKKILGEVAAGSIVTATW